MYALVETGGKQYKVEEGMVLDIERVNLPVGAKFYLDKVLMIKNNSNVEVGNPSIEGAKVACKVLRHDRAKKIIIFKYKPKKNYRRKKGHRQEYTRILVEKIET